MVFTEPYVDSRVMNRTALPNYNVAGLCKLAAVNLNAQAFAV